VDPLFNDEIDLGNLVETIEHGEVIISKVWESRLANQLDDTRSEFYQGASVGLKPELTFEIHDFEYNNEEYVRYPSGESGKVYTIIRAPKRGEMRELVITTYVGSEV
jgi:hypothetical protein